MSQKEQMLSSDNDIYLKPDMLIDPEPGILLEQVLNEIFKPKNQQEKSFIENIDYIFSAEGEIEKLAYESLVNYLIRRLVNTGDYIRRQLLQEANLLIESEKEQMDVWGVLYERLRIFFRYQTRLSEEDAERIIAALVPCIRIKNQDPKIKKVKRSKVVSKQAQSNGELRCYICGCSTTKEESVVEHSWPKAFGGSKSLENLRIACDTCNKIKDNHIQTTDFHYERISLASHENESGFLAELNRVNFYKIALWARSDYSCTVCGKRAEEIGQLDFTRKNSGDSWHFVNIDAVCSTCKKIEDPEGESNE